MTIDRRFFIGGTLAAAGLSGCGAAAAAPSLTVSAQGVAHMNPGPNGADRPLALTVMQMRSTGAFDAADFFSLQDPAAALGSDFVKADQIVLTPGTSAARTISIEEGVSTVGIVAGFRDPGGKVFRAKMDAPAGAGGVIVTVSPDAGIALTST